MTSTLRLAVLTVAAAVGLGFGGTAFAAYNPALIVAGTTHTPGSAGPVVIGIGQVEADDATAVATIYSPLGYRVTLGQAPGTALGALSAVVKIGGARSNVEGTVTADNPANHVGNTCSPGLHEAVWILELTVSGTPVRLPMYVDRVTAPPEAAYASARMRICFPSPYVPPPQGAVSGSSVIAAALSVRSVFRNPAARGRYTWNAVFVPYTPGTATPNQAGAAQGSSVVRLPTQLTMRAKRQKRGRRTFAVVTACLSETGRAISGVRVNILGGATARRARRVAFGRANARGCVTRTIRIRTRLMFFRASADVPVRRGPGCAPAIVARCSQPSVAPVFDLFSRTTVRVRR